MSSFRDILARALGFSSSKVNVDAECDYPLVITPTDYYEMYKRSIGKRVVEIYPHACWSVDPEVYETEDVDAVTDFEVGVERLKTDFGMFSVTEAADINASIGEHSIIVLNYNDDAETPLLGVPRDLNQPLSMATISARPANLRLVSFQTYNYTEYTMEPSSVGKDDPRYNQPEFYVVGSRKIHWTRVIHVCYLPGSLCHSPIQESVWNYLLNLKKTYGGSAAMTWQGGYPGISMEPLPPASDGQLIDIDVEAVRDAVEKYRNGLQRFLMVEGFTPKLMPPSVFDPSAPIEVQLKAIATTIGVPIRIFLGTEESQLAGSQDKSNWKTTAQRRREKVCSPFIVVPLIKRLVWCGELPMPKDGRFYVKHKDSEESNRLEMAKIADTLTAALAKWKSSGLEGTIPLKNYLMSFLGMSQKEAVEIEQSALDLEASLSNEPDPQQDMLEQSMDQNA